MSYEPKIGDKVTLGGDTSTKAFAELLHSFQHYVGRSGVVYEVLEHNTHGTIVHVRWDKGGLLWVPAANLLPATAKSNDLTETVLALPDADRQRIYKLLYNSGCRINR